MVGITVKLCCKRQIIQRPVNIHRYLSYALTHTQSISMHIFYVESVEIYMPSEKLHCSIRLEAISFEKYKRRQPLAALRSGARFFEKPAHQEANRYFCSKNSCFNLLLSLWSAPIDETFIYLRREKYERYFITFIAFWRLRDPKNL